MQMRKIKFPQEMPFTFEARIKGGIEYEVGFILSDEAFDDPQKSQEIIRRILAHIGREMDKRLTDPLEERRNFLDRMRGRRKILGSKLTLTNVAGEMGMSAKQLGRYLDRHFANIAGNRTNRLKAALEASEKESRGKVFMG
jgi:hypothetical protein